MKYLIALLIFCSAYSNADNLVEEVNYDRRISRLYTCGKFYAIVGNQRKDTVEKQRYQQISSSSIDLANNLIERHQVELGGKYKKLVKKYNKSGGKAAIQMVKNIGNSPSKDLFGQYVRECYSFHEKESLFDTIDKLHESMTK